jgi:uncharacterized protein (TIGR02996 family)
MAVYFVFRSHYEDPSGKRLKRFEDATLLDWFRNHWLELADPETGDADRLQDLLGFWWLGSLFNGAKQDRLPPPKSEEQLREYIEEHLYTEGEVVFQPHALTDLDNDDELEYCYYAFDDVYLAEHPGHADFLLHDDWRLPEDFAEESTFEPDGRSHTYGAPGTGAGAIYNSAQSWMDSCNLSDLAGSSSAYLTGVRIPDLASYLCSINPAHLGHLFLLLVRSQLLAAPLTADPLEEGFRRALLDHPDDDASWNAYSDFLQDHGNRSAGVELLDQALRSVLDLAALLLPSAPSLECLESGSVVATRKTLNRVLKDHGRPEGDNHEPEKSLLQVAEHVVVMCIHVGRWDNIDHYQQWIFFDDLWASAHPDLANSILRYDRTWDVLADDEGSEDSEDEDLDE